jgi:hypothetical protein
MNRICSVLAIVLAGLTVGVRTVSATPILALSNVTDSGFVVNETHGYSFTALDDLIATDLGIFDLDLGTNVVGDGLTESHTVGLWKADGTLLSSVLVPAGTAGTLVGGFRYESITPVLLEAGATFVVGAHYLSASIGDAYAFTGAATFTWDSLISVGSGLSFEGGFGFPTKALGEFHGGPNLIVSAAPDATPVPEPGTLALLGAGLVSAAAARRRTRR